MALAIEVNNIKSSLKQNQETALWVYDRKPVYVEVCQSVNVLRWLLYVNLKPFLQPQTIYIYEIPLRSIGHTRQVKK
jgi:hypothetical protein